MNATLTELHRHTAKILGPVIHGGKEVTLSEHGKPVARIRRTYGVSKEEFLRIMREHEFSAEERAELHRAARMANEVTGHVNRD